VPRKKLRDAPIVCHFEVSASIELHGVAVQRAGCEAILVPGARGSNSTERDATLGGGEVDKSHGNRA
jgi:hypothetical protein